MTLKEFIIKSHKPILFFDIETTGLDKEKDRIIDISIRKYYASEEKDTCDIIAYDKLIFPDIPIPQEITTLTGVTQEMVSGEKTFKELANEIYDIFTLDDPVIAGYNHLNFDLPILSREFQRVNASIEFPKINQLYIDIRSIYIKKESRKLSDAYLYYCGEELQNGHRASTDTEATEKIFEKMLEQYNDIGQNAEEVNEYCGFKNMIDLAGKFKRNEKGEIIFTFGKYKNEPVSKYPDYQNWILNNDFPSDTKNWLKKIQTLNNEK